MRSVTIKELSEAIKIPLLARQSTLIMGCHGIGKSTIVHDLSKTLAKDFDFIDNSYGKDYIFPVIDYRLSQLEDVGDLIGLPFRIEHPGNKFVTTFAPMARFYQACEQPCFLFLDELDRANMPVRQGAFQISGARSINGIRLHPDTVVIAATNSNPDTGDEYNVGAFDDPAEFDRWVTFYLKPTAAEHLTYLKDRLPKKIYEFIKKNHVYLKHDGKYKENNVYPSPRSWEKLGKALTLFEGKSSSKDFTSLAQAYIGYGIAKELQTFITTENYIGVDDVLGGTALTKAPKLNSTDIANLRNAFIGNNGLNRKPSKKKIDNLIAFMRAMPREHLQSFFIMVLTQNQKTGIAVHAKIPELGTLNDLILEKE